MTADRKILIVFAALACAWFAAGSPLLDREPAPAPRPIDAAPAISAIIKSDKNTANGLAEFYADAAAILPDAVTSNGQLRQALQESTRHYFPTIGTAGQFPGYSDAVSDYLTDALGNDPEKYDPQKTRAALESLELIHR